MIYLASPYSHPDPAVRHARYLAAEDALAWLLNKEIWTYSPIVHCHHMAIHHKLPIDAVFWASFNHAMINRSTGLFVLMNEATSASKGVRDEVIFTRSTQKPVSLLYPSESEGYIIIKPVEDFLVYSSQDPLFRG